MDRWIDGCISDQECRGAHTEDAGLLASFSSPKDIRITAFDLGVVLGVSRC